MLSLIVSGLDNLEPEGPGSDGLQACVATDCNDHLQPAVLPDLSKCFLYNKKLENK